MSTTRYNFTEGTDMTLLCESDGVPAPTVTWSKTGGVSNFSYPVEYYFSQVKNCSHLLVRPVSNVVLLPCRTKFINNRYIRIHFKSSLNCFLLFSSFVFCNSHFYRLSYIRRLRPSCATVVSNQNTKFNSFTCIKITFRLENNKF